MNYKMLVNKKRAIREHEITGQTFTIIKAIDHKDILIDQTTWMAFLKLQQELCNQGIEVEIDSAYRSLSRQASLYEEFVLKYGIEYAGKIVAPVGSSEHHTGLAIDLSLKEESFIDNYQLKEKEDIWKKIHKHLPQFGFILRYPKGKEHITEYPYEPWHIRYVGKKLAVYLTKQNLTLEEYYNKEETIK